MQTQPTAVYLDNNATTSIDPEVLAVMLPWLGAEGCGNPSSPYAPGRKARVALDEAREQTASLLGSTPEELIFTGSGTESINTAIQAACSQDPDCNHIIISAVEHSATLKLCEHLARRGYEITYLPVDALGHLDPAALQEAIRPETALVSLLWANNETGVLFPTHEIAAICQKKKIPLHLDAVQAVGKLPVRVNEAGITMLSLSGHKLHAPKGVGALYVNRRFRFTPLLRGSQESSRRGGTENVASIIALGKACELAARHLEAEQTTVRGFRDRFENSLLESVEGVTVNGDRELRLPNTSNLAFSGIESEGALMLLDAAGIYCSAGSACTAGSVAPSHVLRAMGLDAERARSSLRFSFGRFNRPEEIDFVIQRIPAVIAKLRSLNPGEVVISSH